MNIIIIYIYIRMNYNNIKYLEVSNNNNNSFYNSVFEILEGNYGKIFHNNEEIVSGTHLRKIIVKDIILINQDYYIFFKPYLKRLQLVLKHLIKNIKKSKGQQIDANINLKQEYNNFSKVDKTNVNNSVKKIFFINNVELDSLISNNLLDINVEGQNAPEILNYLKVKNRKTSQAEKECVKKYILDNFKICIIDIYCDNRNRELLKEYYNADKVVKKYILEHKSQYEQKNNGDDIINKLQINILIADNINRINSRIEYYKTQKWYNNAKEHYKFCIIVGDDNEYNIFKIGKKIIFREEDLEKLIHSKDKNTNRFHYSPESKAYISARNSRQKINTSSI
jgi:hypothetical protein